MARLAGTGMGTLAVREHGLTWPTPFSGIEYAIDLEGPGALGAFLLWMVTGCAGTEGVDHMHNFAVDTSRNRVYGSALLMQCAERWHAEVND